MPPRNNEKLGYFTHKRRNLDSFKPIFLEIVRTHILLLVCLKSVPHMMATYKKWTAIVYICVMLKPRENNIDRPVNRRFRSIPKNRGMESPFFTISNFPRYSSLQKSHIFCPWNLQTKNGLAHKFKAKRLPPDVSFWLILAQFLFFPQSEKSFNFSVRRNLSSNTFRFDTNLSPIFTARRTQKRHKLTSEGSSETGAKVLLRCKLCKSLNVRELWTLKKMEVNVGYVLQPTRSRKVFQPF